MPTPLALVQYDDGPLKRRILLIELPVEILSNIFTYFSLRDVVIFGQCCRILHHVSNERQIWFIALKAAVKDSHVFMPTYPMSTMSAKSMKAACVRPWKLRHKIWSGKCLLKPTRVQILLPYDRVAMNDMQLIPGGRFLLTTDKLRRLCLWDLGHGTDVIFSQDPLAMKQLPEPGDLGKPPMLVHATADGKGVVCCIVFATNWADYLDEVHILQIYPTSNRVQFVTVAAHELDREDRDNTTCRTITCDTFGYHANDRLVLWNFRKNIYVRVAWPGPVDSMLILSGVVLVLQKNRYSIFSMRTLTTNGSIYELEPIISGDFNMNVSRFSLLPTWYIVTQEPAHCNRQEAHVDVTVWRGDSRRKVHRYTLSISPDRFGSPSITFLQTDEAYASDKHSDPIMRSFLLPGDDYASVWLEDLFINIRVTRKGEGQDRRTKERKLYEREVDEVNGEGRKIWSFCPFAGRICLPSFRGEIRVMDFVK